MYIDLNHQLRCTYNSYRSDKWSTGQDTVEILTTVRPSGACRAQVVLGGAVFHRRGVYPVLTLPARPYLRSPRHRGVPISQSVCP